MNNCLILGSGRSGTSMMGGILHDAGYFMGDNLYKGRDSNPKGFFENAEINGINETILEHYDSSLYKILKKISDKYSVKAPAKGQRWLSLVPENVKVNYINEDIANRITDTVKMQPFGYKDPRFSYTLSVWKKFFPENMKYIVMFRAPDITANSIVKECSTTKYLQNLNMNYNIALKSWSNIYKHIMKHYKEDKEAFLFVHYDQIYSGAILSKISKFLNVEIKNDFVEKELKRSLGNNFISDEAKSIYIELLKLAEYKINTNQVRIK